VAAYLEILAEDGAVPLANDADPRWAKLAAEAEAEELDDEWEDGIALRRGGKRRGLRR
jgi:hypothetical protein